MSTIIINANIITETKILNNYSVKIFNGKITQVAHKIASTPKDTVIDAGGKYLSSGFIDIHVHGGGGSDFMDATQEDFNKILTFHVAHGTTGMLATTLTSSDEELFDTINCYNTYVSHSYKGSRLLGLHLEGPYFSHGQRGAQDPKYLQNPHPLHYNKILDQTSQIKRWSAAPELEGTRELAFKCRERDIIMSMAHTDCTAKEAFDAYQSGYELITHFYSCMNSVIRKDCYRIAGLIEAGYLIDGLKVEIIADGSHLPPELLKLIFKIKGTDNICLVTDCSSAGGLEGVKGKIGSRKNGQPIIIKNGVAFLEDMSGFAGSIATTDILLETMLNHSGATLCQAVQMLTTTPAKILGLQNSKGKIAKGYDADIVVFDYKDKKVKVTKVFVEGFLQ